MSESRTFLAGATVTVDALVHDIWAVWVDVNGWPTWDDGLEKAQLHGNFKVGNGFTLKPEGADPVEATLVSVTQGEEFTDEVALPFGTIRTQHRLAELDELVAITHEIRAEIAGPQAGFFAEHIWPELQAGVSKALLSLADVVGA
jgi:hypothetical protein